VTILQAIILGLTQGASEYAPISSSGHLILVPWMFGWEGLGDADLKKTFDVALHLGTLLGAVVYFRHDIVRYTVAWWRSVRARSISTFDEKLAWALIVGTVPGVIVGALFESFIEDRLSQPWLVTIQLAVFGVVLYLVDRAMPVDRGFDSVGIRTGWYLGGAQALALSPGVSRSGITMTAARAIGIDREGAARFSFMLSLPVIAGAGLYKSADLIQSGFQGYEGQFFWGFVSSAISGFVVIWFLLRYLRTHSFAIFMWYRLGVAAIATLLIATGARSATL
jgi:undecaprenyl-diphosphatase